jgi:hypothetical protein
MNLRVNIDDIECDGDVVLHLGTRLTGILYELDIEGSLCYEEEYTDGFPSGYCRTWWEPGRLLPLYWRTGDFKHSLVSIGLNPMNGSILSVTVTQINKIDLLESQDIIISDSIECCQGIPVCDVSYWNDRRYKDDPKELRFIASINSLTILFDLYPRSLVKYQANNAIFYVDSNNYLYGFTLENISKYDMDLIIETLG